MLAVLRQVHRGHATRAGLALDALTVGEGGIQLIEGRGRIISSHGAAWSVVMTSKVPSTIDDRPVERSCLDTVWSMLERH